MKKILIVDDEEDIRVPCGRILSRNGYDVVEAANGVEALGFLATQQFDLLVTDIIMPEKDGIELIRAVKADYPHILIIAISGGGSRPEYSTTYLKISQAFGAELTLPKPISPQTLLDKVKEILEKS